MFDFFVDLFGEMSKKNFRYQVDSGKKIAVQGYKNVLTIQSDKIVIKLFDGELTILGENLKIKEFGQNTLVATGNIFSVSTDGVQKQ